MQVLLHHFYSKHKKYAKGLYSFVFSVPVCVYLSVNCFHQTFLWNLKFGKNVGQDLFYCGKENWSVYAFSFIDVCIFFLP